MNVKDVAEARKKRGKCGLSWCIGIPDDGKQFCRVHERTGLRDAQPPAVSRELELRYLEETRAASAAR